MTNQVFKPLTNSLIMHLAKDNIIDFKIATREELMPKNIIDFRAVVQAGTPMPVIRETLGLKPLAKVLGRMIANFCGAFNVSKNMTPPQIADYAITLIEEDSIFGTWESPCYRLEDYAVFFERAKSGRYGKPFDYIDGALINSFMTEYHKERANEHYKNITNYNEFPELPEGEKASPENIKKFIDEINKQLIETEEAEAKRMQTPEYIAAANERANQMLDNRRKAWKDGKG